MGIEWYRDLAIAIMGLMSIITLIAVIALVLAAYAKISKIMSKAEALEQRVGTLTEKRIGGYSVVSVIAYLGMLAGSVIYGFKSRKTKQKSTGS